MVRVATNQPGNIDLRTAEAGLFPDDTLFCQRILKQADLYTGRLDGDRGQGTRAAIAAFAQQCEAIRQELGGFDPRSEAAIRTLLPKAQRASRALLKKGNDGMPGFTVKILSGSRTYSEQDALYRQGRSTHGSIVTNARGGQSNHNFGIAFDVGIFDAAGKYLTGDNAAEARLYRQLAAVAGQGLEWGGNWQSIQDLPHYQLRTGLPTSQVRLRFESGQKYV